MTGWLLLLVCLLLTIPLTTGGPEAAKKRHRLTWIVWGVWAVLAVAWFAYDVDKREMDATARRAEERYPSSYRP